MLYAEVVINRHIVREQKTTIEDIPLPEEMVIREEISQGDNPLAVTFYYHVPDQFIKVIQIGQLVAVPFRTEKLPAVIIALHDNGPIDEPRPISAIISQPPLLTPTQIEIAQWLSAEYLAPLTNCIQHFLPHGLGTRWEYILKPVLQPHNKLAENRLTAPDKILLTYLRKKGAASLDEVEPDAVNTLIELGLAQKEIRLAKIGVNPKMERMVTLTIQPNEVESIIPTLGRKSKQAELLLHLAQSDDPLPTLKTVLKNVGCTKAVAQTLQKKGYVELIPAETLVTLPPQISRKTLNKQTFNIPFQQQTNQYLASKRYPITQTELASVTGVKQTTLKRLLEDGHLIKISEPTRITLKLPVNRLPDVLIELRHSHKHINVLRFLTIEDGPVWLGWVYAQTQASPAILESLQEAGYISISKTRRWRDPLANKIFTLSEPPHLTREQQLVQQHLTNLWPNPKKQPILLHGVTGSGKTEIYLQMIALALAEGKQTLLLVPEITLATQMVERVSARFPGKVALWHSALSPGERYDNWERVRNNQLPVVVGARSALFAPLHHLGLIIMDEEHDSAYKNQSRLPFFHAREMAIKLAQLNQAMLILGSASPDVESYRRAERGNYYLLSLPRRVLAHSQHVQVQQAMLKRQLNGTVKSTSSQSLISLPLPSVEIVDLRAELKAGNRSIFSQALQTAMHETLSRGEQIILFLNRRGLATFINCRDCGYVQCCPECDTTLTYHAQGEWVVCHYCGYRQRPHHRCPECESQRIRYFGLGTQRVENAVRQLFPEATTLRWDQDTSRYRRSHETFLHHFMSGQANIMVGTQMVTKGLDLPLVTLVGVISADTSLYHPDFRASERTFQMLMQVAGRAGRSPLGGRVIIQTYRDDLPIIQAAARHDYTTFYNLELAFRREQQYPPFKRLAVLLYSGPGQEQAKEIAQAMAERLQLYVSRMGLPAVEIVGPTPHYVQRLHNQYRWFVLIRATNPADILRPLMPLPNGWRVDIDPISLA